MIKAEVEGCGGLASLGFAVDADGVGVDAVLCEGVELSEFSPPVGVLFFFFAILKICCERVSRAKM